MQVARELVALPHDEFIGDVRNGHALRMALVGVVKALCGAGLHILREGLRVGAVEGYVEIVRGLVKGGVVSASVGGD